MRWPGQVTLKGVLLDIDGTLVDSNDMHVLAWQEAFARAGVTLDRAVIHDQIGKGADMLVPALLPTVDAAAAKKIGNDQGKIFGAKFLHQVKAFGSARDLLARISDAGHLVVLASSADQAEIDHYVTLLDAADLVCETTSADDVQKTKPAPDIFAAALKRARLNASDAIVIGDTPYDMEAALAAGLTAIGVRSGRFSDESLIHAGASALYDDVAALLHNLQTSPLPR